MLATSFHRHSAVKKHQWIFCPACFSSFGLCMPQQSHTIAGSALLTCFTACVSGDYTGPFPCTSNDFNGETIPVYDSDWLVGGNDEVVW